jgi:hypothetical protein
VVEEICEFDVEFLSDLGAAETAELVARLLECGGYSSAVS